jgi:WD40 repeat protein
VTDVVLSPYEAYLYAEPVTLLPADAVVLGDNLFGPKPDQDLFATVAALAAHGRTNALQVLYSGDCLLHAAVRERVGSAPDRGFAARVGAPFRPGEPAVSHAVRALAGLGLTLADDDPSPQWLQAALAWHEEARCAPATLSVPWSPAELSGGDQRLRERLELLAEVAGPRRQAAHVVSVAMTLRCLAHPSVRPDVAALLLDPGAPLRSGGGRRLRSAGSSITVLFDQGRDGIKARLRATVANGLPRCLIADPERMSLLTADEDFQHALSLAWQQAGPGLGAMVLWSIETAEGPQRYLTGESLGAAFAVIIDELRRLRRPLASLLAVRRLVSRNAVIGKIDDLGYLQGVEGYDTKLTAFSQEEPTSLGRTGKVIIPQIDHQKAIAAGRLIEPKAELVPVGRWKQAARRARGSARRVLVRDSLVIATVAALVVAGLLVAHQNAINGQQSRRAAASRFAEQSEALDTTDPVQAAMLATAAWKIAPTPTAWDSLLDVLAQPARGVLDTGRSPVYGLGFSPSGALLATAEEDGAVQVWNVATHREAGQPFHLPSSNNLRATAIFSPNGKILAAAGTGSENVDSVVELRDASTGRLFASLTTGNDTEADALAFSPNSRLLALSTAYGKAYLFNVLTRKWVNTSLSDDSGIMSGLAFSPKGNILATASVGGKVQLWDVASDREIGTPLDVDSSSGWTTVAFSPNGNILAAGTRGANGQISLWNVSTHRQIGALDTSCSPNDESFSPDGQVLAVACSDGNTRLFDVATEVEINPPLTFSPSQTWSVAYSPDDSTMATGSANGTVTLWDDDAFRQIGGYMNTDATPAGVAYSPNDTMIATANTNGTLQLWDAASHQQIGPSMIADKQKLWNAAFSPNGKLIATASDDGSARIWSVATRQQVGVPMTIKGQTVFSVAFSPNGKIFASGGTDDTARLWAVTTHREIGKPLNTADAVIHLAFSPNGRILATGSYEGTDELWSVATRQPIVTLTTNGGSFGPLAFNPNGTMIATASAEGAVQLWNTGTGSEIGQPFEADDLPIIGLAFADGGRLLVTGSTDGTARIWDVATDQEIGAPISSQLSIAGMQFNSTGSTLAIVSGSYATLLDLALPDNLFSAVCSIASGKSLAAGSWRSAGIPAEQVCPN